MKIENDTWFWELIRLDEFGLSPAYNFVIPDKLCHFLFVFCLSWLFSTRLKRPYAVAIAYFLMMGPWELVWDGMFRYGFSWRDAIANTLGAIVAYWWLGNKKVGQKYK